MSPVSAVFYTIEAVKFSLNLIGNKLKHRIFKLRKSRTSKNQQFIKSLKFVLKISYEKFKFSKKLSSQRLVLKKFPKRSLQHTDI